jgi:hypothetical protein
MSKCNFFDYLERSTQQERETIANTIKAMYNELLTDENEFYTLAREEKKGRRYREKYVEVIGKIGIMQRIFDILHVDVDPNKPFDLPEEFGIPLF